MYHCKLIVLYRYVLPAKLFNLPDSKASITHKCKGKLFLTVSCFYKSINLLGGKTWLRLGSGLWKRYTGGVFGHINMILEIGETDV